MVEPWERDIEQLASASKLGEQTQIADTEGGMRRWDRRSLPGQVKRKEAAEGSGIEDYKDGVDREITLGS